jgi:hypothetical protein
MQILLANAKIMFDKADRKPLVAVMFAVGPVERNHYRHLIVRCLGFPSFLLL